MLASGLADATGKFVTPGISFAAIQSYTLTASYSGDANFTSSTATYVENVLAASTITLDQLAQSGRIWPGGNLQRYGDGHGQPAPADNRHGDSLRRLDALTTTPLTLSATGGYTFTISTLATGTHSITAR